MSPFAPWVAGGCLATYQFAVSSAAVAVSAVCLATCALVTARLAYRRACADIEAAFRPRPDLYRTRPQPDKDTH